MLYFKKIRKINKKMLCTCQHVVLDFLENLFIITIESLHVKLNQFTRSASMTRKLVENYSLNKFLSCSVVKSK